jgi:hypothetical protein
MATAIEACRNDLKDAAREVWSCSTKAVSTMSSSVTMVKIIELLIMSFLIVKIPDIFEFLLKTWAKRAKL